MFKRLNLILFILFISCHTGRLKIIADLPNTLNEVSGNETTHQSHLIWMINDSDNKPILYGIDTKGTIRKKLKIDAKNNDWEDLTSDKEGNLYIGDFGNNNNSRKNLAILKVNKSSLNNTGKIKVERITFKYENQDHFPPKKKNQCFDCESFFVYNDSLFLFTKSRTKDDFGETNLYKIPAKQGEYTAKFVSSFNTCTDINCRVSSADISNDGKNVVLLTSKSVWLFKDFKGSDFFNGIATELPFNHISQKEGVCFKNDSILYITDEKTKNSSGFLYEYKLKNLKPKP